MKKTIFYLLSLFLFISCSESKMLSKSLSKYHAPLNYLHDSKLTDCDRNTQISWNIAGPQVMDTSMVVNKINQKILPFLFYNYTEVNLGVNLGQNTLEQDYETFFKEAFQAESTRTSCYTLSTEPEHKGYHLEIQVDTCQTKSTYQRNSTTLFFLLAYSMSFQEIGFPAETILTANVKLHRGQDLILEKSYSVRRSQPFIKKQNVNVNDLRNDFVNNMTESLSITTKDCVEQIIHDLNAVISKERAEN
ncbi:MAG: hypothetical protein AB2L24_05480 [Mangrovibacterium sp.]